MVFVWSVCGSRRDLVCLCLVIVGSLCHHKCSSCGLCMVLVWSSSGPRVVLVWSSCVFCMVFVWSACDSRCDFFFVGSLSRLCEVYLIRVLCMVPVWSSCGFCVVSVQDPTKFASTQAPLVGRDRLL